MSKKPIQYPDGWDDDKVRRVLEHYEAQSEEEAANEDAEGRWTQCSGLSNSPTTSKKKAATQGRERRDPLEWMQSFLRLYRATYDSLTPEEIAQRSFQIYDFRRSCEIHWIRLIEPDIQIIIVHGLPADKQDEIHLYGPFEFDKVPDELEGVLSTPPFQRPLSREEVRPFHYLSDEIVFRNVVESRLLNIVNNVPHLGSILKSMKEPIFQGWHRLEQSSFDILIHGDLMDLTPLAASEKLFPKPEPQPAQPSESPENKPAKPRTVTHAKGFITSYYPPIWIAEENSLTFRDKTANGMRARAQEFVISQDFEGHRVIIDRAGDIIIIGEDQGDAVHVLNGLMLGTIFAGIPVFAIHPAELGDTTVDLEAERIRGSQYALVSPRTWQTSGNTGGFGNFDSLQRRTVPKDELLSAFNIGERLIEALPRPWIVAYLAGFTHYQNMEYSPAFLMLWSILEQHINLMWKDQLKSLPAKRRKRLSEDPTYWSTDRSIEILNLLGVVSQDDYSKLKLLKGRRNRIVHYIESVREEEAKALLEIVTAVLRERLEPKIDGGKEKQPNG